MTRDEEIKLIEDFLETGDRILLDRLFSSYLRIVYTFVYKMTQNEHLAEDATQETFVKVWKNFRSFDKSKSFKVWILQIAKNTALDILRKKKNVPFSWLDNDSEENYFVDSLSDDLPWPEELSILKQESEKIRQAIEGLPVIYQEIFLLKLTSDMSLSEMAELFEESENTVKSRYARGLRRLRDILEEKMHLKL
jgi:RNA polymerase sigma factor (sigma-70 family)